jgi:methyltransferase
MLMMLAENARSRSNEQWLRAQGAIEPADDLHAVMKWVYPATFTVMAVEGAARGVGPSFATVVGLVVFAASKALKYWAIASLGRRWTFRVLVLPGVALVDRGPYAFLRHPNYIAVLGELVGMTLLAGARVTGPLSTVVFGWLMWRRIGVEHAALRHSDC